MRSKLMTSVMVVAGVVLAGTVAAADDSVQDQLQQMEKRMAEMEARLQATSDELRTAKATAQEQEERLTEAGLIEADDRGARSGVPAFLDMIDISGVVAGSFNYRFIDEGDRDAASSPMNDTFFRHPNADSFQFDQFWLTLDKTPTDESRGGMHVELVYGETANSQGGSTDSGLIYSAYASYLAPGGFQFDVGRLATPLGGEVLQTNQNFNITTGAVFGLQPVTHTGISVSKSFTDNFGMIVGVVNEVYSATNVSTDRDKAYYGQLQFGGDMWALNVGDIVGEDPNAANCQKSGGDCNTSVFDIYASVDPVDNFSTWINFDWVRNFGDDVEDATPGADGAEGDAFGFAWAGRFGLSDSCGIASRVEYVWTEDVVAGTSDDVELLTITGTVDTTLVEGVVAKAELRWDNYLVGDSVASFSSGNDDQLVGLLELYFEY